MIQLQSWSSFGVSYGHSVSLILAQQQKRLGSRWGGNSSESHASRSVTPMFSMWALNSLRRTTYTQNGTPFQDTIQRRFDNLTYCPLAPCKSCKEVTPFSCILQRLMPESFFSLFKVSSLHHNPSGLWVNSSSGTCAALHISLCLGSIVSYFTQISFFFLQPNEAMIYIQNKYRFFTSIQ